MILLCSTSALIKLVTGGSQAVAVSASWVDADGSTFTPGGVNTAISSATTTTVVPSPGSSTQRNVKFLSIRNTDASVAVQVTIEHTDGTTTVQLENILLPAGYTYFYEDGGGWYLADSTGGRQGIQGVSGSNGTNGTNGTNAGNTGSATLNFGAAPGNNTASVVITGQTGILSTSACQAFYMTDTTSDHNAQDHMFADLVSELSCGTIVPGTGFTIYATASDNVIGTFEVRFNWA